MPKGYWSVLWGSKYMEGKGKKQGGWRERSGCEGLATKTLADLRGSSGTGIVQSRGVGIRHLYPCIAQSLGEGC